MTSSRFRAALAMLFSALVLAAASLSEGPAQAESRATQPRDAGVQASAHDAGLRPAARARDAGAPLSSEDLEVVENLELLEHMPESDVLDLLLLAPDE